MDKKFPFPERKGFFRAPPEPNRLILLQSFWDICNGIKIPYEDRVAKAMPG